MYKVLIVDDEPIIRKGLKKVIHWDAYECMITGEAKNGIEGIKMVRELRPDIIFTDIKMPMMSGLEMIKEIKDIVPACKIIILTGYRDFSYAQEAVHLGAFELILKPSNIEILNNVLKSAVNELKVQQNSEKEFERLKTIFNENKKVIVQKTLLDLMYGFLDEFEETERKLQHYEVQIGRFVIVLVQKDTESDELDKEKLQILQYGIVEFFNEMLSDSFYVYNVFLNVDQMLFIIQSTSNEEISYENLCDRLIHIQSNIENRYKFTVSIGVSNEGVGIRDLSYAFKQTQDAMDHKLYFGNGSTIFYKDLTDFFTYDDHSNLNGFRESLLEGIKAGNEEQVQKSLLQISKYTENLNVAEDEKLKGYYWNTIQDINGIRLMILSQKNSDHNEKKDIYSLYKLIQACNHVKDLNALLYDVALNMVKRINEFNLLSMNLKIQNAIHFIYEHYREPITLKEVADCIFVSTYYASRLFKKELGKSFIEFLNQVRVEKAKEMLRDVQYKTYEVADYVGISDSHYFSKIFKKYVGITPSEFKDLKNLSGF